MADDLYAQITARIDEMERIAREADDICDLPHTASVSATWSDPADQKAAEILWEHARRWDPATVLRGLAEDRDILQRHQPRYIDELDLVLCAECNGDVGDFPDETGGERGGYVPCSDVASLARRHGLEVPQ